MTTQTKSAPARPKRRPPRLLQVVRTTDVTPHMRRVTLGGDDIEGFPTDKQGSHVKVFIPRAGQDKPELPTLGPNGPQWPPADVRPYSRTYTIRRFHADRNELDVDFVLHDHDGPASQWAKNAQPGDWVGIAGPGGRGPIPQDADWYIFAGDESALPAISAHLETLPASARGVAFVEVADAAEEQPLEYAAAIELNWLHRGDAAPGTTTLLPDAVRSLNWPGGSIFVWTAGEAAAVADIRHYARVERGLDRSAVDAVPYWKAGQDEEAYHAERHRVMDAD